MSEVVLHIDDTVSVERIVAMLAPYISAAQVAPPAAGEARRKIWDGNMDCLRKPWKTDACVPLKREELYDR